MKTLHIQDILTYLRTQGMVHQYLGAADLAVAGFSSLGHYKEHTMTWVRTAEKLSAGPALSQITLLFAQEGVSTQQAPNAVVCEDARRAFFSVVEYFYGTHDTHPAASVGTYLSPGVKLGRNVRIGCNCVLDGDITVGEDTVIWHNVTMINQVRIGARCVIQSGAVIGHDGFGFTEDDSGHKVMIRHYGGVTMGDDVWVGPGADIIRGTLDDTQIGDNCKIDANCHIAHNVVMEASCGVVANSVIMGSVYMEHHAYVASGIVRDQLRVGAHALVGVGAVVTKSVAPGDTVAGVPAVPRPQKGVCTT